MIKITEIKTEHKVNALGVDGNPLISWKYEGDDQISYRLKVKLSEVYGKGDVCVFDSGEVNSADNFCRADGEKLERGKKYDVVISLNGERRPKAESPVSGRRLSARISKAIGSIFP